MNAHQWDPNQSPSVMYAFVAGLAVLAVFTVLMHLGALREETSTARVPDGETPPREAPHNDPFADISLQAESAIVVDLKTGETLYQKNAGRKHALASLTKLMSGVVITELLPEGETVLVDADAIRREGDNGLLVGERFRAGDLLGLSLLTSSNDGVFALRRALDNARKMNLIQIMNNKAEELGLESTYFLNASGLDLTQSLSGAYGTAHEVAELLDYIYRNHLETFRVTSLPEHRIPSLDNGAHAIENTNEIAERIPSLLISKTGYTDIAGGNLAVVFEKEPLHPVAIVVLGSTYDARFRDVEKLVWAAIAH